MTELPKIASMRSDEVCDLLIQLEQNNLVNEISLKGFKIWPIIRFCLWSELTRPPAEFLNNSVLQSNSNKRFGRWLKQSLQILPKLAPHTRPGVTTLFISHPSNLQVLPSTELSFDRIIDPLYFLARNQEKSEKLYVAPLAKNYELYFNARYLRPIRPVLTEGYSSVKNQLIDLYQQADLPLESVNVEFGRTWKRFVKWHQLASKFFDASPDLQKVYLSNWYFPEMMGVIAAAKERGIQTIDVQHGKQGRYQGMYSWWTCIPPEGYSLLPDHFWCWGTPSSEHIMASSRGRKHHLPIVGGFPWPDFYRSFLSMTNPSSTDETKTTKRILVTLQGRIGQHLEPIPDFIIDHLHSDASLGQFFIFRGHPNFAQSLAYCEEKLRDVPPERYSISDSQLNLYDELLGATHHITAFSSCCYEAEMFGVPTLLFGSEAKIIYEEEIKTQRFGWTAGKQSELSQWLTDALKHSEAAEKFTSNYIVSSLSIADRAMQGLKEAIAPANLQCEQKSLETINAKSFLGAGMGPLVALMVSIISLPLITRLYSPTDFGQWALGVGFVYFLGAISTLRYDLAVVVESNKQNASALFWLTIITSLTVLMFAVVGILVADYLGLMYLESLVSVSGHLIAGWILIFMLSQVLISWHLRQGAFLTISITQVGNVVVMNLVHLIGALEYAGGSFWLVVGSVCGQTFTLVILSVSSLRGDFLPKGLFSSVHRMRAMAWKHRRFLKYTLPYTLFGAIRERAPLFVLSVLVTSKELGLYGQAQRLSNVPAGLTGAAIRPVLFHGASRNGLAALEGSIRKILTLFVLIGVPVLAILSHHAEDIFGILLGGSWGEIGPFIAIMAFPALAFTLSNWMDRLVDYAGHQNFNLWTEVAGAITSVFTLIIVIKSGAGLYWAVFAQSVILTLNYLFFIYLTYRMAGYDRRILVKLLFLSIGMFFGCSILLNLIWPQTGAVG